MDQSAAITISHLAPGFSIQNITVTVDRVIIRESRHSVGNPERIMKCVDPVDILCWDEAGTRIIGSFTTPKGIETQAGLFSEGHSYCISRFLVKEPGLAVHPRFHLELDDLSSIIILNLPFIDRVFNLRCPSDIPSGLGSIGTIFDIGGFVRHVSHVGVNPNEGYAKREVLIIMDSRLKDSYGKQSDEVIVHLRGSSVDGVCSKLKKLIRNSLTKPFILVKHLRLARPSFSGRPVLNSVDDATRVLYKLDQQAVVELQASLIAN